VLSARQRHAGGARWGPAGCPGSDLATSSSIGSSWVYLVPTLDSVSQLTVLENLGRESWENRPRVLSIHAAIGDTSSLIDDLMMSVRHRALSPLLLAMEFGLVRLFVAHHVWAEVPRKVEALGAAGRLDQQAAEILWWTRYVPLCRVVDTAAMPSDSTVEQLWARDPSDAPTAVLAGLLSPVVVLAVDPDLIDLDYAGSEWRPTARAGRNLAEAGGVAYGSLTAMTLAGKAFVAGATGVSRLVRHPYGQLAVVLSGLILFSTRKRWAPASRARSAAAKECLRGRTKPLVALAQSLQEHVHSAYEAWDASQRGTFGGTLTHAAARQIAVAPASMSLAELADDLEPEFGGSQQDLVGELRRRLRACSAFVEVNRGQWQLGRAGADFGGSDRWRTHGASPDSIERYARPTSLAIRLAYSIESSVHESTDGAGV